MNRAPRIRLSAAQLDQLLAGGPVEGVRHSGSLPKRSESYPITLYDVRIERTEVRAIIVGSMLRQRPRKGGGKANCEKSWDLSLVVDRSDVPLTLNPESAGGVIIPLGEERDAREAAAHGYKENLADSLEADEPVPHEDVLTATETQAAAERFAKARVNELTKKRARSLGVQVRDVVLQARAHGVDVSEAMESIEATLAGLKVAMREAA